MRGVASIRTETHLRRFLHGIRLFCNAHSPPKALSHQSTPHFFKAPYGRWQYGLLSPYFATLNTGSCYAIAPLGGQYTPPLRLCARATPLRAYAYATRPIAVGNTGSCRPISLRSIRALVALFRYAQYGLLSPYFAALNTGSCYAIAPRRGQYAPPLRLCAPRSAACAHTPTQLALLPLAIRAKVTQFIQSTSK